MSAEEGKKVKVVTLTAYSKPYPSFKCVTTMIELWPFSHSQHFDFFDLPCRRPGYECWRRFLCLCAEISAGNWKCRGDNHNNLCLATSPFCFTFNHLKAVVLLAKPLWGCASFGVMQKWHPLWKLCKNIVSKPAFGFFETRHRNIIARFR